jgi:acetyltransferase-like isoleucine patch superfamily enzyme
MLATIGLRRKGAEVGRNVRMQGMPILSGDLRGIALGDRVVLTSDPRGTALGVRCPTILRILRSGAKIKVGADTGMSGVVICAAASVSIGERCLIGADVMIFDTDFHPIEPKSRRYAKPDWETTSKAVVIQDDVFIGARSIVMKGAHIGRGSVIAANSVVTGHIPPMTIAAGTPAKIKRRLD